MRKYTLLLLFFLNSLLPLSAQQPDPSPGKGAIPTASSNFKLHPEASGSNSTRAVVVGISDYQDPAIPDLRFADRDAAAFLQFLQASLGISAEDHGEHFRLLVNEKATTGQMVAAFDWLLHESKPGDLAIIYFSGHCDVETKYLRKPGFLLGWDAPARAYSAGALAVDNLQDVVQTLSVQNRARVLLITDACHAGKLAGSAINGAQLAGAALAAQLANEMKILSCQTDELSLEGSQWGGGRGVFSYHLVEGLYGLADQNSDSEVSLLEIGRYLEDRVSADVAPQKQLPLVMGNKMEPVARVNPALLEQLQRFKAGELPVFAPIEGRGLEEMVLAGADSSLRMQYAAFKMALQSKQFFGPDAAEAYYARLSAQPHLAGLHLLMRRNYAAALQDDAQQTVNAILKTNVPEVTKSAVERMRQYRELPRALARAAELLGPGHYMYKTLKARQLLFEGLGDFFETYYSEEPAAAGRVIEKYRQALQYQPESPLIHYYLGQCYALKLNQPDSAYAHAREAMRYAETWVLPYAHLAYFFARRYKRFAEAEEMLRQVTAIDPDNVIVRTSWGALYYYQDKYPEAIDAYRQVLRLDSTHTLAWTNIGIAYVETGQFGQAETALWQAIRINPRQFTNYYVLGCLYLKTGRQQEAEASLLQAIGINPMFLPARDSLANLYNSQNRIAEAEAQWLEMTRINPALDWVWYELAAAAATTARQTQALEYLERYFEKGGTALDYLTADTRFDKLRALEDYQTLLKKYFPDTPKE